MEQSHQHDSTPSATFNPHDHLILLKTVHGQEEHYPFWWRLHEFRLRYPSGVLQADILLTDVERDLVVVKVTALADGLDDCKGVGLQSGSLTLLDQVTERAKAQALLDMGIGCPWPVIFHDQLVEAEIVSPDKYSSSQTEDHATSEREPLPLWLNESIIHLRARYAKINGGSDGGTASWNRLKLHALGGVFGDHPIVDQALTREHLEKISAFLDRLESATKRTPSTVQAFFMKAFQIRATEVDERWQGFKRHHLGRDIPDDELTEQQLNFLNGVCSQQWQKRQALRAQPVASKNGANGRKVS